MTLIYTLQKNTKEAYQDHTLSFEELLITDNQVSSHQQNLQMLVTEISEQRRA